MDDFRTESPTTAAETTTEEQPTTTIDATNLVGPDGAAASTSEDSGGLSSVEVGEYITVDLVGP